MSKGENPDQIKGSLRKEFFALFVSDSSDVVLDEEYDLNIKIPAQLPEGVSEEVVQATIATAGGGLVAVVII
jgi:hypothetical protein